MRELLSNNGHLKRNLATRLLVVARKDRDRFTTVRAWSRARFIDYQTAFKLFGGYRMSWDTLLELSELLGVEVGMVIHTNREEGLYQWVASRGLEYEEDLTEAN